MRARNGIAQAEHARAGLNNLKLEYEHGQNDYMETLQVLQDRVREYQKDINDTKDHMQNQDKLIQAYQEQIAAAEKQIRDLQDGARVIL